MDASSSSSPLYLTPLLLPPPPTPTWGGRVSRPARPRPPRRAPPVLPPQAAQLAPPPSTGANPPPPSLPHSSPPVPPSPTPAGPPDVGRVLGRPNGGRPRDLHLRPRARPGASSGSPTSPPTSPPAPGRACKSIAARKLAHASDAEDVRREVQIMHHLTGHRSIVELHGAYEDRHSVNLVMELCEGGELFDRIIARGHYSRARRRGPVQGGRQRRAQLPLHGGHAPGSQARELFVSQQKGGLAAQGHRFRTLSLLQAR
ncbi:hypothetical protein ACQ4PT_023738 [Festuca glaucescens]